MPLTAKSPDVIVVGSITVDVFAYSDRTPIAGETVIGSASSLMLGGKGANQAVASARAGAETQLVGSVGIDLFGDVAIESLAREGVDCTHVKRSRSETGIAHIRVNAQGENNIVMVPNANNKIDKASVRRVLDSAHPGTIVLCQLEIPLDCVDEAVTYARKRRLMTLLDPAPFTQLSDTLLGAVDVLTPNEVEACQLSGMSIVDSRTAMLAAQLLVSRGPNVVIITRGEHGVVVASRDGEAWEMAAMRVGAIDTTAAGDCFSGYLAAELSSGADLRQSVSTAVRASSISTMTLGSSQSIPLRAQL